MDRQTTGVSGEGEVLGRDGLVGFYLERLRWRKKCFPWKRKIVPVEDAKEKKANGDKYGCVSWCRMMKRNIFCSLWLKRLHMIFSSAGGYKLYLLAFSNTISVFNLQNSKFSTDFSGASIDLQQFQTNIA